MTRRFAAVLLAGLTVSLAAPGASQAAPTAKAEARRLLAPLRSFEAATRGVRPQVRDALTAWQAKTTACLAGTRRDLAAAANPSEENTATRVLVLYFHTLVDGYKQSFAPTQAALDRAERQWRRMRVTNSRLRLLTRWQSDGLALIRRSAVADTCSFYAEWKAAGFDIARIPEATNTLLERTERFSTVSVGHALRRLRQIVGTRLASRFEKFPLAPTLATETDLTAPLDSALA